MDTSTDLLPSKSWAGILILAAALFAQDVPRKPKPFQLYPRDAGDRCQVAYEVRGTGTYDSLVLEVYAGGAPHSRQARPDLAGQVAFASTPIASGLTEYRFLLKGRKGAVFTELERVDSVVCGDAFIVGGQSNGTALRCDDHRSEWVRGYGRRRFDPARDDVWGLGLSKGSNAVSDSLAYIGCWPWYLGDSISRNHKVPVAFIQGSQGGSTLDMNMKDTTFAPGYDSSMYWRVYSRAKHSGLSGRIKAIFWHQGENDQNPASARTYLERFKTLAGHWRGDYPGNPRLYVWQLRAAACVDGGGNALIREAHRRIGLDVPNATVTSTFGIFPYLHADQCHWLDEGYRRMAGTLYPMMARDLYGKAPDRSITSPNIAAAGYGNAARDEIVLQFDQEVAWDDSLTRGKNSDYDLVLDKLGQQYLKDWITFDDTSTRVVSVTGQGSGSGDRMTLKLSKPSGAKKISYAAATSYPRANNTTLRFAGPLIYNKPGTVPALTFLDFPVEARFAPVSGRRTPTLPRAATRVGVLASEAGLLLEFPAGQAGFVIVELSDAGGRLIHRRVNRASGKLSLNVPAPGTYFLTLRGPGILQQEAVILP